MKRNPDVLERLAPLSGAPSRGFEDLLRRRAKRELARKVGAIAVVTALIVALLGIGIGTLDDRTKKPANPPEESHAGTFTGMVITYTSDPYESGDLVAQDPATGEVRTVFHSQEPPGEQVIYSAAISGDGRWVAFNVATGCKEPGGPGLWVTNGVDEPRQLMEPCGVSPNPVDYGHWEWSPSGAQLLVVLGSPDGDSLVLIDPATGDRSNLGQASGHVTSLAWSPDGSRIAYGTVPVGTGDGSSNGVRGSVYSVDVRSGDHTLLADVIGGVPGGEEGAGIRWSPDGSRIAVLSDADTHTLYVMNADGSERRPLAEGVLVAHTLGSPNIVWSPDGTRIAYATFSRGRDKVRIWNGSPDGSTPALVFDPKSSPGTDTEVGGPTWSPDGTQIAFRYDSHSSRRSYLVVDGDGSGVAHEIDELQYRGWRGGWYFCECYG
jgi:WD40 repeat protein